MRVQSMPAATLAAACLISLAVGGCGEKDQPNASAPGPTAVQSAGSIEINIVTKAHVEHGRLTGVAIQPASSIGGAPFCTDGTAVNRPGNPEIGHIARTITCSDGTILMGMELQQPGGKTGTWRIVSGTGAYTGWTGSGTLQAGILDDAAHVAQEEFDGTVVR